MQVTQLEEAYRERLRARQEARKKSESRAALISWLRLAVFGVGLWVAWLIFETDRLQPVWILLPVGLFLFLVFLHASAMTAHRRAERAEVFYARGLSRLEDRWAGTGMSGAQFADGAHPYARDCDLFGKGSLYELLATTVSPWGSKMLADWLLAPAEADEVRARQRAVEELAPRLDLRETVATDSELDSEELDPDALSRWATEPSKLTSQAAATVAFVLGLVTLGVAIAWIGSWVPRAVALTTFLVSGAFALWFRTRVKEVMAGVEHPSRDLAVLSSLLERLEQEAFATGRLRELEEALVVNGGEASQEIHRLRRMVEFLDARRNQLFLPLAAPLLWGTQFAFAIERWRQRIGPRVPEWLRVIAEFDALLALSAYRHEHPQDAFPEIVDGEPVFDAKAIGHPLIPADRLVRNDFRIGGELRLVVVSGSNMSGKSTLLRAIGVNTVLALAGAPVHAARLAVSPFQLAASIRVVDSLQDGISHFYAEILRLRQVAELADGERPLLFLLDEILHGTNSHDRRIGAEAVVRGLADKGALGLITTHDLALARVAEAMGERASNVHFVDHLEGGKMSFDYKMRPGVVEKSNAIELMRSVGLDV